MERELDIIVIRTTVEKTPEETAAIDALLALYVDRPGYTIRVYEQKTIVYKTIQE